MAPTARLRSSISLSLGQVQAQRPDEFNAAYVLLVSVVRLKVAVIEQCCGHGEHNGAEGVRDGQGTCVASAGLAVINQDETN